MYSHPTLKTLLNNELSAAEAYSWAARNFPEPYAAKLLEKIQVDHERRAGILKKLAGTEDVSAIVESEYWDTEGHDCDSVNFLKSRTLISLKAGEQGTVSLYERALESDDLGSGMKLVIRETLMPPAWNTWLHLCSAAA